MERVPTSFPFQRRKSCCSPPDEHAHTHSFASVPWESPTTLAVCHGKFFRPPPPHPLCGVSFGGTQDWHKLSSVLLSHWSSWAECVSHRPRHTRAFHFLSVWDVFSFKWVNLLYHLSLWFLYQYLKVSLKKKKKKDFPPPNPNANQTETPRRSVVNYILKLSLQTQTPENAIKWNLPQKHLEKWRSVTVSIGTVGNHAIFRHIGNSRPEKTRELPKNSWVHVQVAV